MREMQAIATNWTAINESWAVAQTKGHEAVLAAADTGQLLLDAMGEFETIREFATRVGKNVPGMSKTQMQGMMDAAKHRDLLEAHHPTSMAQALKLWTKPRAKTEKEKPAEKKEPLSLDEETMRIKERQTALVEENEGIKSELAEAVKKLTRYEQMEQDLEKAVQKNHVLELMVETQKLRIEELEAGTEVQEPGTELVATETKDDWQPTPRYKPEPDEDDEPKQADDLKLEAQDLQTAKRMIGKSKVKTLDDLITAAAAANELTSVVAGSVWKSDLRTAGGLPAREKRTRQFWAKVEREHSVRM